MSYAWGPSLAPECQTLEELEEVLGKNPSGMEQLQWDMMRLLIKASMKSARHSTEMSHDRQSGFDTK